MAEQCLAPETLVGGLPSRRWKPFPRFQKQTRLQSWLGRGRGVGEIRREMWVTLLLALLCLPVWLAARLGLAAAAAPPAPAREAPGRERWVVWAAGCVGDLDPSLHRLYILLCEEDGCPLMKTKASGWGGNRRFKDHSLTLLYGIVGTKPAGLTNGQASQAYPALVHWFPPQDRSKQAWFSGSVLVEHYLVTVEFHN